MIEPTRKFIAALALVVGLAGAAAAGPAPAAPTGFGGTAQSTTRIRWAWTDNSNNEMGFRVMSGTVNVSGNLASNTTFWLQANLSTNTLYGPYFVQAFNGTNTSNSTGTVSRYTLAAPPASLSATAVTSTTATLSWSANGNPSGTVFQLQRDGVAIATTTSTSYADSGLSPRTTYTYDVRAFNGDNIATTFAGQITVVTQPPDPPAAPSGFIGTAVSETSIIWTWTDHSTNETAFRVMSGTVNVSGDLPANTTSWLQAGLTANTEHGPYVVRAFNAGGSADSNADSAYTLASTPQDLEVTAVTSTTITLDWTGNGTIYEVWRDSVLLSSATATTYTDAGLTPQTTYSYEVRAFNGDGIATAFAGPVSTTTAAPDPPAAPGGFSGTAVSETSIEWTWMDNSDNETGFRVMFGSVNVSGDLAAGTTVWLQTGLSANTEYGPYFAQAFNAGGSADSNSDSAYTLASTPEDLVVTAVSSTTITLDWNGDGTFYEVFRDAVFLASTTATGYTDTGLTPETTYSYQVRAFNGDGIATAFAGPVSTMTAAADAPAAPSGFAGAAASPASIEWSWTDNSDNEAGFRVLSGTVNVSGDLAANTSVWLQTGLSTNTLYGPYFVQAFNAGGTADSNTDSAYTLTTTPEDLAVTAVTSTTVTLEWTGNGTVYEVWRDLAFVSSTTLTTYTDVGLTPGATYSYQVSAFNGDGVATAFAGPVSTTTSGAGVAPGAPGAPSGFAVGTSSISWTWTPAAGADSYNVYLTTSGTLIGSTTVTLFLQTGLSPNTSSSIRVAGVNAEGGGPLSPPSPFVYTFANPPDGTTAAAVHQTSATVAWSLNGNSSGTTAEVQRSTSGLVFTQVFLGPALQFTDTELMACTTYQFRVRNFNGDGFATTFDDPVQLVTPPSSAPPPASSFQASALDHFRIRLTWAPSPSADVASYRVYYDSGTGTIDYTTPLATLPGSATSYTTDPLSSGTYRFGLRAVNGCGIEELNVAVTAEASAVVCLAEAAARIKSPKHGASLKGNRVTVVAEIITGKKETKHVQFQYKPSTSTVWLDLGGPDTTWPYFVHWDVTLLPPGSYDLRAVATSKSGETDPAPAAITVTVGGASCTHEEWSLGGGRLRTAQAVTNGAENVIYASDEATSRLVKVKVPAGRLNGPTGTLRVTSSPSRLSALQTLDLVGGVADLELAEYAGGPIEVSVGYQDDDEDGVVDGSRQRVERLQLQTYTPASGWAPVASRIDEDERSVTAMLPALASVGVFAPLDGDLGGPRVYPVPFRPRAGNPDLGVEFSPSNPSSGIVFDNLPPAATVKIYTVAGGLVTRLTADATGRLQWDVRNSDGRSVASGGYLAVISASGRRDVVRKLLIIR